MMMAYFEGYPGIDPDDLEQLNATASRAARLGIEFDEAFDDLTGNPPRDVAERAWNDFVAYYKPPAGAVFDEAPEEAPLESDQAGSNPA